MCKQPVSRADVAAEDTLKFSTPQEVIVKLMAGNERYVSERSIYPRTDMDRIRETAPHQAPFAAVVSCSDSRVPVELLFDQGIGDLILGQEQDILTIADNLRNSISEKMRFFRTNLAI